MLSLSHPAALCFSVLFLPFFDFTPLLHAVESFLRRQGQLTAQTDILFCPSETAWRSAQSRCLPVCPTCWASGTTCQAPCPRTSRSTNFTTWRPSMACYRYECGQSVKVPFGGTTSFFAQLKVDGGIFEFSCDKSVVNAHLRNHRFTLHDPQSGHQIYYEHDKMWLSSRFWYDVVSILNV